MVLFFVIVVTLQSIVNATAYLILSFNNGPTMKKIFLPLFRQLSLGLTAFVFSFSMPLSVRAQSVTESLDSCEVIVPKEYTDFLRTTARRVPSHFDKPSASSIIKNRGKVYTFRLATCILPEYVLQGFGNGATTIDKEAIKA